MFRKTLALGALLSIGLAAACGSTEERIATLDSTDPAQIFKAPTTAPVGEPVAVIVKTMGGSCAVFGRTEVKETPGGYSITPYHDLTTPASGSECTAIGQIVEHPVTLTFEKAGDHLLTVHGRYDGQDITVEWPITIE